ncbi:ATP-dependent DNA ligase [Vibrio phage CHOED]|uniref:ATP-dependent DNA ligase n=1 Tax=Vibrio phage CHOED TaxID=1458716 RepID=UPI00042EEDC8|nr:ATP-dependent DNA ligase [Vibrio phage CHOED]AHK11883.1 ATP-dependent DNA ligase [Vibrio phage CHOED]
MAKQVETIWDYLESLGYSVVPRPEKKVVHLVLESDKINSAQAKRMATRMDWSEKLDGVYSLVTVIPFKDPYGEPYLEVKHWGRSGKAQSNLEELDRRINFNLHRPKEPIILISEVTSDDALAKLSGYVNPNRTEEGEFTPTNLQDNFHDILTFREFIKGESDMTYHYRKTSLQQSLNDSGLNLISGIYITFDEAKKVAQDVWARGGEGLVGRDIHALWTAGTRNETAIKLKEKLSYDVTVVGMVSGKEGSKYENTLGKLVVAFRAFGDSQGELLWIPISGMTDKQRDEWWNNPASIVGQTVKMDAKSFTETGNLREPRYKETRHDKSSDFPVKVLGDVKVFSKGKARHFIHELEIEE